MNKDTSIFLDAVRFLAALAVFLGHIELIWAPGLVPFAAGIGTPAVGIFFLLSGFVIAFAVDRKETDTYSYFVNRAARVYSVVVPVLALTMTLDLAGSWLARDIYGPLALGTWKEAIKQILSLTFVNQVWFLNIVPGSNGPFWSLAFEVPYYLIFGLWHFGQTGRWRLFAVLALVAAGPEIALLFLLWLAGVVTYTICTTIVLTRTAARVLLGVSLLLWALLSRWSLHYYAQFFAAGIPFAFAIIGFSQSGLSLERWETPIRWLAGATFTLYLVHYPIGVLLQTQIPTSWPISLRWLLFIAVVMSVTFLLAEFTERRKDAWRRLLTHLFSKTALQRFGASWRALRRRCMGLLTYRIAR